MARWLSEQPFQSLPINFVPQSKVFFLDDYGPFPVLYAINIRFHLRKQNSNAQVGNLQHIFKVKAKQLLNNPRWFKGKTSWTTTGCNLTAGAMVTELSMPLPTFLPFCTNGFVVRMILTQKLSFLTLASNAD